MGHVNIIILLIPLNAECFRYSRPKYIEFTLYKVFLLNKQVFCLLIIRNYFTFLDIIKGHQGERGV